MTTCAKAEAADDRRRRVGAERRQSGTDEQNRLDADDVTTTKTVGEASR